MPRDRRGGARVGRAGASYPNRSDMRTQPVRTPPSTSYGEAAASERAQQAIPLPAQAQGAGAAAGMPAAPAPLPGDQPLGRPSDRPGEPLTAGLPIGAGLGPSASMPTPDPVVAVLREGLRRFPNQALAALLEAMEG